MRNYQPPIQRTHLGKGRFPRRASSATYPTIADLHRLSSEDMLSVANRRRAFSWSKMTGDKHRAMYNAIHSPWVVLEHIKNNRSKHQYEKRSLGTNDPNSVLPRSYCWSRSTFSTLTEFCAFVGDVLVLMGSKSDSYSTLPRCRICASWLTR
jgi:hypothetical protein